MAQRSRLSPQTEPDEIRAARVEESPEQVAPRSRRAALLRGGEGVRALLSGSRKLVCPGFRVRRIVADNVWLHEMELVN